MRNSGLIFSAALAASAFLGIGASSAADLPTRTYTKAPPMVDQAYNWSGWYIGGTAGYGFGSNDVHVDPVDFGAIRRADFTTPVLRDDPKGFIGGVEAGWNQQTGQFVYGVEADISYANIRDTVSSMVVLPAVPLTFLNTDQQKLNWFGTVRGRAGVAFDKSLIYATGGLAFGQVSLGTSSVDIDIGANCASIVTFCTTANVQQWRAGWTVGAGWEYAFASNWSAKIEYLYYDLGKTTNTMLLTNGFAPVTFQGSAENRGNIVRVGVNYHFNGPVVARY
jgi:outer membrane immunogenic protein